MNKVNLIKEAASQYLAKGWVSIPIQYQEKSPAISAWQKVTLEDVNPEKDFAEQCNIGVLLGEPSNGLVDIDLDCTEAVKVAPFLLPPTGLIFGRASNPKSHYLYQVEDCGRTQQFKTSVTGTLIEYRATGSQTVFPPSIHIEGEPIEFVVNGVPRIISRDELLKAASKVAAAAAIASVWSEGSRHFSTLALSGVLLRARWSESEVLEFVEAICIAANDEELKSRLTDVKTTAVRFYDDLNVTGLPTLSMHLPDEIVRQVCIWLDLKKPIESLPTVAVNNSPPIVYQPFDEKQKNDTTNAKLFSDEYKHIARYCGAHASWFVYNGKCWVEDNSGRVIQLAQNAVKKRMPSAMSNDDLKWLSSSLNAGRLASMVKLAQPDCYIDVEEFDQKHHLLNCENGTLDLTTGNLLRHDSQHLITRIIPVAYDSKAECPRWNQFLHEVMDNDKDMVSFLQRAVGYTLTGLVNEHCLFICIGSGRNGKSTFSNILSTMMGPYAKATPIETLMAGKEFAISNDIARLTGVRFVSASEGEVGQRFAEAKIKRITGGDRIPARFMYGDLFEFNPQFKLWLGTNNLPDIKGNDEGIWRRIRVINFGVTISPEKQDRGLEAKLKQELPGILKWAVDGCFAWNAFNGLHPPASVVQAGKDYRSEMDTIAQFIGECCMLDPSYKETTANLFNAYTCWVASNGEKPISKIKFGKDFKARGFAEIKIGGERGRKGISLREEQTPIPAFDMPIDGIGEVEDKYLSL